MHLISPHILDSVRKLEWFWNWGKAIDINPVDETLYTTQWQEVILMYVENGYCVKHRCLVVSKSESILSNNLFPSAMPSISGQLSYDAYDLSSDDDEYIMPKIVAEMMRWRSDHAVCLMTATRHYLNSPPELPWGWGQINPNLHDYNANPMEIRSRFWVLDITDQWCQQEETYAVYTDLSNVAHNPVFILPHSIWVEAILSLRQDVIGWR